MIWHIIVAIIVVEGIYFIIADLIKHDGELEFTHAVYNKQIKWIKTDKYDRIKIRKAYNGEEYEEIIFFDNTYKKKVFAGYLSFDILPEHKKMSNVWCEQVTYSQLEPVNTNNKDIELYFKIIGKDKKKVETNSPHYVKKIIPLDSNYQEIK